MVVGGGGVCLGVRRVKQHRALMLMCMLFICSASLNFVCLLYLLVLKSFVIQLSYSLNMVVLRGN